MTTIANLVLERSKAFDELRIKTGKKINEALADKKLDKFVRRKRDNKIGVLRYDCWTNSFSFYPITKKGYESERANGYVSASSLEDDFEPVEEATK